MIRAFIDYQNTYRLLKDREGFCLLSLRMGALVTELIESVGEKSMRTHRAFSGIHSADVDPESRIRRLKQFCALRHQEGIEVYARDYAYRKNAEGYLESREKGIDVRLGCEVVAAAATGKIDGAPIQGLWRGVRGLASCSGCNADQTHTSHAASKPSVRGRRSE